MIYLDAGTTYSKVISDLKPIDEKYLIKTHNGFNYYILPSKKLKELGLKFDKTCGHMSDCKVHENEIIALANGCKNEINSDATILDLGSRDAKWIGFKDKKFHDMDWNTSCASSTGATVEMLLKFYDLSVEELEFCSEKFAVTCGVFGLEKIMDDISNGIEAKIAVAKFIHGIAYNAWNFAKKPDTIYLSGGFCHNKCFVDSLQNYCEVVLFGRFKLCEGLMIDE
ncbi:MAG: BadF/BadG/BcrA/BcrD ATPase family protein [Candidatus Gastranaerophilales bacterium]